MSEQSSNRPNIVLILVDDMGYSDIGCYGSEIRTPHLDQLAAHGARFSQAYNTARCCPSRACLLTGLYPHQAGVGHMVSNLGVPAYQGYLRDDCVTIAEVLRTAGYQTLMTGKWHVGGTFPRNDPTAWATGRKDHPLPPDRGFDEWYGTPSGAGSYFNPKPLFHNYTLQDTSNDDYYYTDAVTDNAVDMMDRAAQNDAPFFLYVAYTAPHWPLHAPEEDIARYEGQYRQGWDALRTARHEELKGLGMLDSQWDISPRDENARPWETVENADWEDRRMAVYAAQIDRLDQGIGRITGKLRDLDLDDNTLVIFLSDNGGCAELLREEGGISDREWKTTVDGRPVHFGNTPDLLPGGPATYMSYDLPWANASNAPFRLFKSWVHEGGISTPMIVHWPEVIPAGLIQHSPVHFVDFMATLLDITGTPYPIEFNDHAIQPLAGESFLPALGGKEWQRERPIMFEHEGNRAIRDGRWKLVNRHPGQWELYDIITDRTELIDLAAKNKPRVEQLVKQYHAWAEHAGVLPWDQVLTMIQQTHQ